MMRMWALPVLPALLALAWIGCTETEGDGKTWTGNIRNTCGPADGPALYARFGKGLKIDCPASIPRSGYGIHVDGIRIDSLKPGMVIKDSIQDCIDLPCPPRGTATIEVLRVGPNGVSGSYEIKLGNGESATVETGPVELKVCPQNHMCG